MLGYIHCQRQTLRASTKAQIQHLTLYPPKLGETAQHQKLAQVNFPGWHAGRQLDVIVLTVGMQFGAMPQLSKSNAFPYVFQATPPVPSAQGTSRYSHPHMHNSTIHSRYTEHNTHVCTLHTGNEPLLCTTEKALLGPNIFHTPGPKFYKFWGQNVSHSWETVAHSHALGIPLP